MGLVATAEDLVGPTGEGAREARLPRPEIQPESTKIN